MAANKVVFGEEVIMDLTGDSVSPENLLAGETAHDRAGNPVTGAVITHDVVDNLESTSTEDALSANQGRELKEMMSDVPHREDDEGTEIEVPNIDADMLNGHPADYYAKQSDLSALNTSVTQVNNKIGNTDISKWGNSLTGAIKAACDKADANETAIADVNSNFENCFIISSEYADTVPSGTTNYYEPILTASIPDGYKLFAITGLRASLASIFFYSNGRRLTYNQIQIGFRSLDTSDLSGVVFSYRFIFIKENMISIH